MLRVSFILFLSFLLGHSWGRNLNKRQADDVVVVENEDFVVNGAIADGGTGPQASIIGAFDNVFKSIRDFDEHKCLERMICEYMMPAHENGEGGSSLLDTLLNSRPNPVQGRPVRGRPIRGRPQFGPEPFPGNRFHQTSFTGQRFGSSGQRFPNRGGISAQPSFVNLIGKRRKRQLPPETNLQGNIIRLLMATGLDSLNAFPYVRAGLIGQASDPNVRGGHNCAHMYKECPTEANDILNYLNNHNGGLVNQVQPSVDNEIGPIVSAIVSDLAEQQTGGNGGSSGGGLLAGAGQLFSSFIGSNNNNNNNNAAGGLLSSLVSQETSLITSAADTISDLIYGKK